MPSTPSSSEPDPARLFAAAVPALVARLAATRPGRVYREALALLERALLEHALSLTRGNQLRAARLLGLNRNTLRKRCLELGLDGPRRSARAGRSENGPPLDRLAQATPPRARRRPP